MKKVLLILILSSYISFTLAQNIKLTLSAGVNESTASKIPDNFIKKIAAVGETFPNSKLIGFHIDAFAAYSVGNIYIQTGLLFTTKGGVPYSFSNTPKNSNDYYISRKDVLRLDYLEIPFNILYNVPIGPGKFFFGGGPYIGIGLSGNASYTITDKIATNQTYKGSQSVTFGSGYDDIKTTDIGLGTKIGYTLNKGLLISFNYDNGFTDLSNDPRYNGKNRTLSLSLGYSF